MPPRTRSLISARDRADPTQPARAIQCIADPKDPNQPLPFSAMVRKLRAKDFNAARSVMPRDTSDSSRALTSVAKAVCC